MLTPESFLQRLSELVGEPKSKRFLVALSGGADSCVAAYLMWKNGLDFAVAHCNFHLRGEESDRDTEFVRKIPFLSGKEIHIQHFDTLAERHGSGESVEMVARRLRYDWFRTFENRYDYIVTAHNADDNAETMLLNLTRGTGLHGLTGIPPHQGCFVRPLLIFSSREIREFACNQGVAYRDDATNFDTLYQRNKIRLEVMPLLRSLNPQVTAVFVRNAELLSRQWDIYENEIERRKEQILTQNGEECTLSVSALKQCADVRLMLYEILSAYHFNKAVLLEIEKGLERVGEQHYYSSTHELVREREWLRVRPLGTGTAYRQMICNEAELRAAGFAISLCRGRKTIEQNQKNRNVVFVAKSKFKYPLCLRSWRAGDFFYPYGMKGKKKLSDFFKDEKLDFAAKNATRILTIGDDIVWVVGRRADRRFGVEEMNGEEFYSIHFFKENE